MMKIILGALVSVIALSAHATMCSQTLDAEVRLLNDFEKLMDLCKDPKFEEKGAKIALKMRTTTNLLRDTCEQTCNDRKALSLCGLETPEACRVKGLPAEKLVYRGSAPSRRVVHKSPGPNDNGTCYNDFSCATPISDNVSFSQCNGGSWKDQWTLQCYPTGH